MTDVPDYGFDELEKLAYRLCLLWVDRSRKVFPDYQHTGMRQGDPRKSLIFKVCYKLARETQGVLTEDEYPLYIRAQLDVLRHINIGKGGHPLIDANCLVGEKAWKRWKLWKRRFDAVSATRKGQDPGPTAPGVVKAIEGLQQTREFISKTFGAAPGVEKYREAHLNNNLFRWINFGKISPYYVALSPHLSAVLSDSDYERLSYDVDTFKKAVTEEVAAEFGRLFPHEGLDGEEDLGLSFAPGRQS